MLVVYHNYEFMSGMTLPYAMYWTHDIWMFAFAKYDTVFYDNGNDVYYFDVYVYLKTFHPYPAYV